MTEKDDLIRDVEQARAIVAETILPPWGDSDDLKVGLEPELFPFVVGPDGASVGRLPIDGADGSLERLMTTEDVPWRAHESGGGPTELRLEDGGRITFEPGGQIEYSSPVSSSARAVVEGARATFSAIRKALGSEVRLVGLGVDPWFGPESVPMQLEAPRYRAMAAYFDRRSPAGAVMMRCTASTQINLDLGPEGVRTERCALAHRISPLLTATFSSSPGDGVLCRRARAWQQLDPTRTGFPLSVARPAYLTPEEICAGSALDADVLLFRTPDGGAEPGEPGFTFRDWIESGHAAFGRPRRSDLLYHLTTLFFEVRVRGFLELRAPDALPTRWADVPLTLVSGLVYDPVARERALGLLDGLCSRLHELWEKAATDGLRDPDIADLAGSVWELAVGGAERLPSGWLEDESLPRAVEFLERFTARGLAPADELRGVMRGGPSAVLSWSESAGWIDGEGEA